MTDTDPRVAFFDQHAARWDSYGPPIGETLRRLEELRPTLGLAEGQDVLEVGCGTGRVTAWLAESVRPGRVTAADFSPQMLAAAKQRGVEADFRCVDVCREDVGSACFDVVFCMHAFPHFHDQAAAVRRLGAALRPGGRLIVLHLDNWRKINAYHDQVGPPVRGDHLPQLEDWPVLLAGARLQTSEIVDRDDLFCLTATHDG